MAASSTVRGSVRIAMHFQLLAVIPREPGLFHMLVVVDVSITVVLSNTFEATVNIDASAVNKCIEKRNLTSVSLKRQAISQSAR